MLGANGDDSVARDTMFPVLMIILNLLLGLALLLGGVRRTEQEFNAQSAGAYMPLIVTLGMITLVLPRFTSSREGGWMSDPMMVFVGIASLGIYAVFLGMQTTRYRAFFAQCQADLAACSSPCWCSRPRAWPRSDPHVLTTCSAA